MATTFTKRILSGSNSGKTIVITGSNAQGPQIIHQAVAGSTDIDELWVWVNNTSGTQASVTFRMGGAVRPNDEIWVSVPPQDGLVLAIPGLPVNNSVVIDAWAGTGAQAVTIMGFVNRIV